MSVMIVDGALLVKSMSVATCHIVQEGKNRPALGEVSATSFLWKRGNVAKPIHLFLSACD